MERWRIHKRANLLSKCWIVYSPDGSWFGAYATWPDAMAATNVADHIEQWLHKQT